MNLWNFIRHQQITISFYLCFCFLWGIFFLIAQMNFQLSNFLLKQVIVLLPVFLSFFSRKIVYKTGWCGFKHRFRAKTIGICYVWTIIFFENGEKNLHFLWKWSWWLSEIIEHCSLRKMQSVIKKNKRGRTKEISETDLISRIAFILMYSKSV